MQRFHEVLLNIRNSSKMGISKLHHMGFLETFQHFQIMLLQQQSFTFRYPPIQINISTVFRGYRFPHFPCKY